MEFNQEMCITAATLKLPVRRRIIQHLWKESPVAHVQSISVTASPWSQVTVCVKFLRVFSSWFPGFHLGFIASSHFPKTFQQVNWLNELTLREREKKERFKMNPGCSSDVMSGWISLRCFAEPGACQCIFETCWHLWVCTLTEHFIKNHCTTTNSCSSLISQSCGSSVLRNIMQIRASSYG